MKPIIIFFKLELLELDFQTFVCLSGFAVNANMLMA